MDKPNHVVCVFCGSSFGNESEYSTKASELGSAISKEGWGLVYGGGTTGLMGEVAKACASSGSYVHGIIPQALVSRERKEDPEELNEKLRDSVDNHKGLTPIPDATQYGKTTIVADMHTRKRLMSSEADAFIALPGGYGTLEELMEVVTWSQLGIHKMPIILFNVNGFYDDLVRFVKNAIEKGFISQKNGDIIVVANTVEEVVKSIQDYKVPEGRYNLDWDSELKESS